MIEENLCKIKIFQWRTAPKIIRFRIWPARISKILSGCDFPLRNKPNAMGTKAPGISTFLMIIKFFYSKEKGAKYQGKT